MEAAFDLLAFDNAVGEVGEPMGAAALGRIVRAADIVDRDQFVADLAADDAVLRHVGGGAHLNLGHDYCVRKIAFGIMAWMPLVTSTTCVTW